MLRSWWLLQGCACFSGGGQRQNTRFFKLIREKRPCSLRVLLPCEHVFHCSCVDEWLIRQGVCPICKSIVSVSSDAAAQFDGVAAAGSAGGAGSRWPSTPQSLMDTGHGTRTAMRARAAATGGGGSGGGSSSIGLTSTHTLHRVAVAATPTGRDEATNRDGRRMAAAAAAAAVSASDPRGEAGVGPLGVVPDPSAGGGGAATPRAAAGTPRVGTDGGLAVRVWESEASEDEIGESGDDGAGARVVVTHYENPLFSHRTAVGGSRDYSDAGR